MRIERTLDSSLCFEVFASERARATFPQLYRSFSFQEELRTDNDLRVYCPGFDRPNPHYRFTHLALQPWMGIRTSRGHWHRFPDVAGHDVDRARTWDRRFLASIPIPPGPSKKDARTCIAASSRVFDHCWAWQGEATILRQNQLGRCGLLNVTRPRLPRLAAQQNCCPALSRNETV